jgi:hypothetical protein
MNKIIFASALLAASMVGVIGVMTMTAQHADHI